MRRLPALFLLVSLLAAACDRFAPAPTLTPTPDPCSAENLPDQVGRVNGLMREFDDYSALASNTPQNQLVILIPEMQRILRQAEDQDVPACLTTLKQLQLSHMNIVVQTLMAFMNSSDGGLINAGIGQARELHGQYELEMARLLGVTLVVQPTPTARAAATAAAPTLAATPPVVTNPGPSTVNLRSAPDLTAPEAGLLAAQASAAALGKSADQLWIQVEIPGQPGASAWVFASLVELSVPIAELPPAE